MNSRNTNREYKLGRSIGQIAPFHISINKQRQRQQKEIITTKLVITIVVIAILKIAVLILWI